MARIPPQNFFNIDQVPEFLIRLMDRYMAVPPVRNIVPRTPVPAQTVRQSTPTTDPRGPEAQEVAEAVPRACKRLKL